MSVRNDLFVIENAVGSKLCGKVAGNSTNSREWPPC